MLKTLESTKSITRPEKGKVGVDSNGRAKRDSRCELDIKVDDGKVGNNEVGKKDQKTSKSKNLSKSKKTVRSSDFFTLGARLAFIKLR